MVLICQRFLHLRLRLAFYQRFVNFINYQKKKWLIILKIVTNQDKSI